MKKASMVEGSICITIKIYTKGSIESVNKKTKRPNAGAIYSKHKILTLTNLNIMKVVIHRAAFWNTVSLVKTELWCKHIFTEPNLSKCIQQSLIIVIGDSASILNFAYHVADSRPGDTLGKIVE